MRRIWGIALAVLLLAGVAFAIVQGNSEDGEGTMTVSGVIGSEKSEFFADPAVIQALADRGLTVRTDPVGSWAMDDVDLGGYDFAFPGSQGPADELSRARDAPGSLLRPFYSPLVVLARQSAAEVLAAGGLTRLDAPHRGVLLMENYLDAIGKGMTWQQFEGAAAEEGLTGTLYVSSTDPRTSNSGALYLAAASYVANGGSVVANEEAARRTAPLLRTLTQVQGTQQSSSDAPFRDFVSGIGNPLVLAYESQVASLLLGSGENGGPAQVPDDLVVLYPDTTVSSDHTLVPLSEEGRELGELLTSDPELRELAVRHGFRPQGATAEFSQAVTGHEDYLDAGLSGVRQAPVPTTEVLRSMAEDATS